MFTHHTNCAIKRRIHTSLNLCLSKLASTFVLALAEEKLTFVLFNTNCCKDSGEAKQNCQKCLHFTVEYLTLFVCQSKNQRLGSSINPWNQSHCNESLLASSSLCSHGRAFYAIASLVILYTNFHEHFGESRLND